MVKAKQGMPPFRYEARIPTDDFDEIIYERDGPIGRLILNGPEKRNPLSYKRICELAMAIHEMEMDNDIRVIIIKGAGPAFCSGYDLTPGSAADSPNPNDYRAAMGYPDVGDPPGGVYIQESKDHSAFAKYEFLSRELYFRIFDCQKPVIAQIHGYCLAGGTHLAGFSDLRFVAEDAQIGFPVAKNLTIEGFQYEYWLMGPSRTKYYLLTGAPMDGRTAYEWGWASQVCPADQLEAETENVAARIAQTDPVLLMMTKRAINRQMEVAGFKTAIKWGMDVHSAAMRGPTQNGAEFWRISKEEGLRAAIDFRDSTFGITYASKEH